MISDLIIPTHYFKVIFPPLFVAFSVKNYVEIFLLDSEARRSQVDTESFI